jgi:hypothetical protein
MAPHPLVTQLRFARGESARDLDGVPEEERIRRVSPMSSISWMTHARHVVAEHGDDLAAGRRADLAFQTIRCPDPGPPAIGAAPTGPPAHRAVVCGKRGGPSG